MRVCSFLTPCLPRQYVGAAAYRKDWEGFLAAYPSTIQAELSDLKVETEGNLAYSHGIFRTNGPDKDGKPLDLTVRVTDVYRKINGKWLITDSAGVNATLSAA